MYFLKVSTGNRGQSPIIPMGFMDFVVVIILSVTFATMSALSKRVIGYSVLSALLIYLYHRPYNHREQLYKL